MRRTSRVVLVVPIAPMRDSLCSSDRAEPVEAVAGVVEVMSLVPEGLHIQEQFPHGHAAERFYSCLD